ncbi:unnamed protein product [Brassica napus]|nr:unnamed protein product [Brassica napus]
MSRSNILFVSEGAPFTAVLIRSRGVQGSSPNQRHHHQWKRVPEAWIRTKTHPP